MNMKKLFLVGVAVATSVTSIAAHEAPKGWNYPWACCANNDCQEVTSKEVTEGMKGYRITKTGEIIMYLDKRIKDSPDGLIHWCAHTAGIDMDKTICLFIPSKGF